MGSAEGLAEGSADQHVLRQRGDVTQQMAVWGDVNAGATVQQNAVACSGSGSSCRGRGNRSSRKGGRGIIIHREGELNRAQITPAHVEFSPSSFIHSMMLMLLLLLLLCVVVFSANLVGVERLLSRLLRAGCSWQCRRVAVPAGSATVAAAASKVKTGSRGRGTGSRGKTGYRWGLCAAIVAVVLSSCVCEFACCSELALSQVGEIPARVALQAWRTRACSRTTGREWTAGNTRRGTMVDRTDVLNITRMFSFLALIVCLFLFEFCFHFVCLCSEFAEQLRPASFCRCVEHAQDRESSVEKLAIGIRATGQLNSTEERGHACALVFGLFVGTVDGQL